MTNNKKTGRPAKLTYDQKVNVINTYAIRMGAERLTALKAHGRFSRLAEFSCELGYGNVKSYDFANDDKICEFLEQLIQKEETKIPPKHANVPAYEPLDIACLASKPKSEIKKALEQREKYVCKLYDTAAKAMQYYAPIEQQNAAFIRENQELLKKNAALSAEKDELIQIIKELKHENKEHKELILQLKRRLKIQIGIEAAEVAERKKTRIGAHTLFDSLADDCPKESFKLKERISSLQPDNNCDEEEM